MSRWSPAEIEDALELTWPEFNARWPERSWDAWEVKRRRAGAKDRAKAVRETGADAGFDPELDVRQRLNRTLRALERERHGRAEYVAAIKEAVADNLHAVIYTPDEGITFDTVGDLPEETAVIVFSDLQLSQVTASYNTEIAEQRVMAYAEEIIRQINARRASKTIRNAKLYMLGDLVEGEMIFPGQPHQVDASLFAQVARHGPRILLRFIRRILEEVEFLDIVSVPGNHGDVGGASRRDYNPETNFDRMLSAICEQIMEASGETRARWTIPAGYGRSSFYAVDRVYDTGFMLWHGHQARRTSSASHLPFYKLVMGWRSGAIPEPFDVSICGHHHTPTMLTMNGIRHFINGTFASDSEYAVERLASNSRAAQWLLFVGPGRGVTGHHLIDLGD